MAVAAAIPPLPVELAGGRAGDAWQNSSNLLDAVLARGTRRPPVLAREILETLGRTNEALQSYTNNLADNAPTEDRAALLKTVELTLAQIKSRTPCNCWRVISPTHQRTRAGFGRLSLGDWTLNWARISAGRAD